MAQRRMFSKQIIDSDAFLDMSASAQSLYFHLAMRADDDGFVNNPKKIQRMIGAADDDLKILIAKRFVIMFESGVIVIKHWRMHNYIRADRYNETAYIDEKSQLTIKENGSYTLNGNHLATTCLPDGNHLDTQVRLGKDSIGKDSIGKDSKSTGAAAPPPTQPKPKPSKPERRNYGEYGWVLLTQEQHARLLADLGAEELSRCITYIDESAQSNGNKNKWRDWNLVIRRCSREGWGRNIRQSAPAKPDTLGILDRMMEEGK
jgi:hypothetical protein